MFAEVPAKGFKQIFDLEDIALLHSAGLLWYDCRPFGVGDWPVLIDSRESNPIGYLGIEKCVVYIKLEEE